MSTRPVLLLEVLGAPGSDAADARLRAAVLRRAGLVVRELVISASSADGPAARARLGRTLASACAAARPDRVVIAASRADAEYVLQSLPATAARWWPTDPLDTPGAIACGGRSAPALFPDAGDRPALETAPLPPPPGRERVGLWDGDFVLVPAPLGGDGGARVLESFAAIAENAHGLDLVVLADPQPRFEAEATRLGIATRVHFAGTAPRTAEHTWFTSAAAALITPDGPVSAGLVVRALAAGCPILPVGSSPRSRALAQWLLRHGCLAATARDGADDLSRRLGPVLARDVATRRAIECGRAHATLHTPESIAARLPGPDAAGEATREVA